MSASRSPRRPVPLPRPRTARRSVLTTAAAAATAAGLLLTAAPAQAVPFERLQGDDRYRTAVAISSSAFPRATTVVLVSGAGFPDALASWEKDYDVVVIDSAPLLDVADTLIIAPLCTGTVLVASLEDTDPQQL